MAEPSANAGQEASARPLAGVCVIDLTRVLAEPFATQVLGDFGADIIKVEPTNHGDDTRRLCRALGAESAAGLLCNQQLRPDWAAA